jgi:hypothetical protein
VIAAAPAFGASTSIAARYGTALPTLVAMQLEDPRPRIAIIRRVDRSVVPAPGTLEDSRTS